MLCSLAKRSKRVVLLHRCNRFSPNWTKRIHPLLRCYTICIFFTGNQDLQFYKRIDREKSFTQASNKTLADAYKITMLCPSIGIQIHIWPSNRMQTFLLNAIPPSQNKWRRGIYILICSHPVQSAICGCASNQWNEWMRKTHAPRLIVVYLHTLRICERIAGHYILPF